MVFLILSVITIFGAFLRFINLSPYKIYPDTYQNFMVANNLATYKSVVGFLGENGSVYPPFFFWTRPVFPLLINLGKIFSSNDILVAQIIIFIAGVLVIPVTYFLIKHIFKSKSAGICGAFLIAISFNHIVWGGFIQTENIGVFFVTLFLLILIKNIEKQTTVLKLRDILIGIFFGITILVRYEYALLSIPIVFLVFKTSATPFTLLGNFAFGTAVFLIVVFSRLYPIYDSLFLILTQKPDILIVCIAGLSILGIIYKFFKKGLEKSFVYFFAIVLLLLKFYFIPGPRSFFLTDILISILALIGILLLQKKVQLQKYATFTILGIFLLSSVYLVTDYAMQRYWTHIIPFLLIPASFALERVLIYIRLKFSLKTLAFSLFLLLLIVIQIFQTYNGIRQWNGGRWFAVSYEEKSGLLLKEKISNNDLIMISSLPEAYHFYTKLPTHSVADQSPFVFISNSLDLKQIIIVQDMGMRYLFPTFSEFLDLNLENKKVGEYFVNVPYHYSEISVQETHPIILYQRTQR
ncbi:MAG: hypothetical protein UT01_C0038G0015 [Candidatus Daviesbacteria bacterium GW2011_GWA1_38_7]|nr:MAG: hypothetical protein UT01_C0038G0015 [Candidatus Daviesbacteria bacterium GW2011_GWA1_38_7]